MSTDLAGAVAALKALGNPARLRIALHLRAAEKAVGEIESELGLRQPNLSQHLAELREVGLVTNRREGRTIYYTLADGLAEALLAALSEPSRGTRQAAAQAAPAAAARYPVAAASFAIIGSGQ